RGIAPSRTIGERAEVNERHLPPRPTDLSATGHDLHAIRWFFLEPVLSCPTVPGGCWPILRARTVQMGSSVGPRLGSGADYSGCPRAVLSSRDQSATDPQSQARQRAA